MTGRGPLSAQTAYSLPIYDRIAPAPSPTLVAARIDLHTGPGDVVVDLFGRGGWVARAAVDRQRRTVCLESSPLTRMLAEVVLRPPDVRHLDAAFQGLAASPRRESSLKVSIGDLFATRCPTCGRMLVADEFTWSVDDEAGVAGRTRPVLRHYRCTVCRDQRGGSEQRQAPLDADDQRRVAADVGADAMRALLIARFPAIDGAERLPDELLDLHTPRQLVGLGAILERIESDLRAAPVLADAAAGPAPRRPARQPPGDRAGPGVGVACVVRSRAPTVRDPVPRAEPVARLRGRLPDGPRVHPASRGRRDRSDPGSPRRGPAQPRRRDGHDRPGAGQPEWPPDPPGRSATATGARPRRRAIASRPGPAADAPEPGAAHVGLPRHVLGPRPGGGRAAADRRRSRARRSARRGAGRRPPWRTRSPPSSRRMARDGRVVQLVDGGPESIAAAVLGGASAGYRLLGARLSDPDEDTAAIVELLPPGGIMPPGPRTRANVDLEPAAGRRRRPGRSSRPADCSRRPSASTNGRSRRSRRRGR